MSNGSVVQPPPGKIAAQGKGDSFTATFQYTEGSDTVAVSASGESAPQNQAYDSHSYHRHRPQRSLGINGYNATPDPPPALYVRALYNYEPDDHTSLGFRQGDIIQVLTQLESGWWDGVLYDVRGWFPSNYCTVVPGPDDPRHNQVTSSGVMEGADSGSDDETDVGPDDDDDYDDDGDDNDDFDDEDDVDSNGNLRDQGREILDDSNGAGERGDSAVWIMQATPDGRIFFFNTLTGVSCTKLPLETPSSFDESGTLDRSNFAIPEHTRPPVELRSPSDNDERDNEDSFTSEADGDISLSTTTGVLPQKWQGVPAARLSFSTPLDSKNTSPVAEAKKASTDASQVNFNAPDTSRKSNPDSAGPHASTTSFSTSMGMFRTSDQPKYFWDDGTNIPLTWDALIDHMCRAADRYRAAIRNQRKADFVRRVEDISDLLRFLLAAGSGTTDNHSGNPSIISANKGLYPHFRDMVSRFSKLVLSSHLAAVDWPSPDAYSKCLQEVDGVLHGVYGYVEVARRQRGEQIPRVTPGFVLGSSVGGHWQNNHVDAQADVGEGPGSVRSTAALDARLLGRIDEARQSLHANLCRLQDQLKPQGTMITSTEQTQLGDSVCLAAGRVIESFKPFISLVEATNLAALGGSIQTPQLLDCSFQKQQSYNNVAELLISCQDVTTPLPDEWASNRGRPLQERLTRVATVCHQFDTNVFQIVHSMQSLLDTIPSQDSSKEVPTSAEAGIASQKIIAAPVTAPSSAGHSEPSLFDDSADDEDDRPERLRRPDPTDKPRRFFGQVPPLDVAAAAATQDTVDEGSWYLRLDHPNEVVYDTKTVPPQIKHGTLTGLVEQLTRHDRLDSSFNRTFLLTYRSFTTASELFELLVRRFTIQPPAGINQQELAQWESCKQKPVRIRVVNVLKNWLENHWMEGNDGACRALLDQMYSFARDSIANNMNLSAAAPLMTTIEQRIKGQDMTAKRLVVTLSNSAPTPILPKNMKKLKFLDIDATEFARQLTIIESKLYGKIRSPECLSKTWQKKVGPDEPDPAPNVKALILHSNQLTNWVAEMILSQAEVKKRVVVIKRFVAIADVSLATLDGPGALFFPFHATFFPLLVLSSLCLEIEGYNGRKVFWRRD